MSVRPTRTQGFSLLEMLVAIAILALALGLLYQAAGGATRNVRTDEKYAYAVELARSVLASNARVAAAGVDLQGETEGGFAWRVSSVPIDFSRTPLEGVNLQTVEVGVSWADGSKRRELVLNSVVEGLRE